MIALESTVGGSKDAAAKQKLLPTKMFPSFAKILFWVNRFWTNQTKGINRLCQIEVKAYVVYFDQLLSAAYSKRWSKYAFSMFFEQKI